MTGLALCETLPVASTLRLAVVSWAISSDSAPTQKNEKSPTVHASGDMGVMLVVGSEGKYIHHGKFLVFETTMTTNMRTNMLTIKKFNICSLKSEVPTCVGKLIMYFGRKKRSGLSFIHIYIYIYIYMCKGMRCIYSGMRAVET